MQLAVNEVAKLLNISERAVRYNALNGKYQFEYVDGVGRGGKQLKILLESLPQEAQDRYYGNEKPAEKLIDKYSAVQIQEAEYKAKIVVSFKDSKLSADKFISQFNRDNNEKFTAGQL